MVDDYLERRNGLESSSIRGANNEQVHGNYSNDFVSKIKNSGLTSIIGNVSEIKGIMNKFDDFN